MGKISKETKNKLKGNETWVTVYEGHEIKIVNKMKAALYIDGEEAARQKGLVNSNITLAADIPGTDKTVAASLYSPEKENEAGIQCRIVIGDNCRLIHGTQSKEGEFSAFTPEEEELYIKMKKEAADDAAVISVISSL